jgi:hypothetical protein
VVRASLAQAKHDPQEVVMEQVCLVVPVQPGRANDARGFMRELEASRKDQYARSEERIGITKEVWFLAPSPPEGLSPTITSYTTNAT